MVNDLVRALLSCLLSCPALRMSAPLLVSCRSGSCSRRTPREEKKQKAIKGLLNKLTPDNFDRLFKQIEDVKIDSPVTLRGLIDQVS